MRHGLNKPGLIRPQPGISPPHLAASCAHWTLQTSTLQSEWLNQAAAPEGLPSHSIVFKLSEKHVGLHSVDFLERLRLRVQQLLTRHTHPPMYTVPDSSDFPSTDSMSAAALAPMRSRTAAAVREDEGSSVTGGVPEGLRAAMRSARCGCRSMVVAEL
jgi:hypothetical protein